MAEQFLRVTSGNAAGTEIALDDVLLIGRNAGGSGSLEGDSELSREHAKITRDANGDIVIEDLDSTNGTLVNGKRITAPTSLRPGDSILLGTSTLEVAGSVPQGVQPTVLRPGPAQTPEVQQTRMSPPPAAPEPAGPSAAHGPGAESGSPSLAGAGGPPPAAQGPPPGLEGPPPGLGGKPGLKALPPPIAARIRKLAILAGLVGFVLGFGVATIIWNVL